VDKIVAIQARHDGVTKIWKEWEIGEEGCLEGLFALLDGVDWRNASIAGYNPLKFDFPFIDERLRALGLMNEKAWRALHEWPHVIDLYQVLGTTTSRRPLGTLH
jgi:DNA polymerase elongation subunit (family B)